MPHPLDLTGERTLPGVAGEEYWFSRHEAAYAWLARSVALQDHVVVDAGSGEGYGAAALRAAGARCAVALDYDDATTAHCRHAYPGVGTVRANLAALPLRDAAVDVVVSLQVVEHLWDLTGFLRDCRRVLRAGGALVVTTPNRPVFSPGLARGERPTNPFHVEEFDGPQLAELVRAAGFVAVDVVGLHHGPRLRAWETAAGSGVVAAQVAAVMGSPVPAGAGELVASCTPADFEVAGVPGAQDLLLTARRP